MKTRHAADMTAARSLSWGLRISSAVLLALTGCAVAGPTGDGPGLDSGSGPSFQSDAGNGNDNGNGNMDGGGNGSTTDAGPGTGQNDAGPGPGNGVDAGNGPPAVVDAGCDESPGAFQGSNCPNAPGPCDGNLALTGPATDMAKSIGICQSAVNGSWGLVSATYTKGYNSTTAPGSAEQTGIIEKFGTNVGPRQGAAFGVLSSGYARDYDECVTMTDPFKGGCAMDPNDTGSVAPPGYPKAVGHCTPASDIHDAAGLTLKIKVPSNAQGFSFDFAFYSGEWPEYVCSPYNDSFVAWLTSSAYPGVNGDLNISKDTNGNPINVNNDFFQACAPANATVGCAGSLFSTMTDACSLGDTSLLGTGFYYPGQLDCGQADSGGGATGWLTTKAPVTPGETITIQFIIWDTHDQQYDSSVLIDNWQWLGTGTTNTTTPSGGGLRAG